MITTFQSIKWTSAAILLCLSTLLPAQQPSANNQSNMGKAWSEIDSLESLGLFRQALDKVKALYLFSLTGNADADLVKALLYQAKYMNELSDGQQSETLKFLEGETHKLTPPVQAVLHSVLGEMYFSYLRNNYYSLSSRTTTADVTPDDISTWSPALLEQVSAQHYLKSVADPGLIQIPIKAFDLVTTPGNATDMLRPTVYDFLAHRAIDHFVDARSFLNAPANRFQINEASAFAEAEEFIRVELPTLDTGNFHYQAMMLFQQVLRLRTKDTNLAAFLDADLKRLRFVFQHATLPDKNILYTAALKRAISRYASEPWVADYHHALALWYQQLGQGYDVLTGTEEQKMALATAVNICRQAILDHPGSRGANQCIVLNHTLSSKDVSITTEEVIVPHKPILLAINYQNIALAHVRVVPLKWSDRERLFADEPAKALDWMLRIKPLQQIAVPLIDPGDYRAHSTEIALNALAPGYYAFIVSDHAGFKRKGHALGYTTVQVSGMAVLSREHPGGTHEMVVVDRMSGAPIAGVKASFFNRTYDWTSRIRQSTPAGESLSDDNGFIRITFPLERDVDIRLAKADDQLMYNDYFYTYRYRQEKEVSRTTHLFLDRGIYRPGQTIFVKGLVVSADEQSIPSVLSGETITLTLMDVNRRKIQEKTFTTNEFGTFNGSFVAPSDGLMGLMSLESSIGSSVKSFRVEEYKRPKFEVDFLPLEKEVALGDSVLVTGQANAYAGYPIDGATVQYRVVREEYFPWAYWWRRGGFGPLEVMELAQGTLVTDESGKFRLSFEATPNRSTPRDRHPAYRYVVYADVTDINGETHSGSKTMHLAWRSLQLNMNMPEEIDLAEIPLISLSSVNLDNQPVPAKGIITIHNLLSPNRPMVDRLWGAPDLPQIRQEKFNQLFPHLPYLRENKPEHMPIGQQVAEIPFDTELQQTLSYDFSMLPAGYYKFTMRVRDISADYYVMVYDSQKKQFPVHEPRWFSTVETSYQPGDSLILRMHSATGHAQVLLDLERNAKPLQESSWMTINNLYSWSRIISDQDRGGFTVTLNSVSHNRIFSQHTQIQVPWKNKALQVSFSSFRNKLEPGSKEEWRIQLADHEGKPVRAEVLAAMYDASLDVFATNRWHLELFPSYYSGVLQWTPHLFGSSSASVYSAEWNKYPKIDVLFDYRMLRYFDLNYLSNVLTGKPKAMQRDVSDNQVMMSSMPPPVAEAASAEMAQDAMKELVESSPTPEKLPQPPRTNLKETVFFYPELMTDSAGNVVVRFTMNEALTRWNFNGLALTSDLKSAVFFSEVVTQKPLLVQPNPPRFVREGDQLSFPAKVTNLSEEPQMVTARLELFDAINMSPVDSLLGLSAKEITVLVPAGRSIPLSWDINIPLTGIQAITHRVTVISGTYSDGEENTFPVLSNRMMVTETLPMSVRGGKTQSFTLKSMKENTSASLINHALKLEFTANPAWYAVRALPYLMEYPYDCAEQLFNKLYANTLAVAVVNNHPGVKAVFDSWKDAGVLQSNLLSNESLKSALISETPWVMDALSETEQQANIALLFDLQRMAKEQSAAISRLSERQLPDGSFAWFSGGTGSWYITQYIVEGLGQLNQLKALDIQPGSPLHIITFKALGYMDAQIIEAYKDLENRVKAGRAEWKDNHLSGIIAHYLYARSFFPDRPIDPKAEKARQFFANQAATHWLSVGLYEQAMIAMAMHRNQQTEVSDRIINSLADRAIRTEEMGMYWPYPKGYWWYQRPIETQALMISLFAEAGKDKTLVEEMKLWLLKNKQTTNWKTTKATAAAVYALLGFGDNWLAAEPSLQISVDKQDEQIRQAQAQAQAGTGYFQTSWQGADINKSMATVKVKNPGKVVAWGSLYWQYFEDMDKIKAFEETPLSIDKQVFREELSDTGPVLRSINEQTRLRPGDKLMIRIEIRVDRDMEYIHLKDMRASGLEPLNTISGYRWQGGLGYYESIGDVAANFFIDYLRKGTYVFEYPLRVAHQGNFSNGITTIQSMYAPEFSSHSAGIRLNIAD